MNGAAGFRSRSCGELERGFEEGQIVDLNGKMPRMLVRFFEIAWKYQDVDVGNAFGVSLFGSQVTLDSC